MQANNQYETIGYVGDVRLLEERGYASVDKEVLHQWAEESTSATYATLFYGQQDDWTVEKEKANLLSINEDIKFEKIDNIQEFKDYLEKGMDREVHPIYTVDMVNNGSSWKENIVEYLNDNVPSSATQAETARIVETIRNPIEALIKSTKEDPTQENDNTLTKAYEKVKEESHYNEAKVIGDEAINAAGKFKTIVDESKEMTKTGMSKFKEYESANIDLTKHVNKGDGVIEEKRKLSGNFTAKNVIVAEKVLKGSMAVAGDILSVKTAVDAIDTFKKDTDKIQDDYEACIDKTKPMESPTFGREDECLEEKMKSEIDKLVNFGTSATGHKELEKPMKDSLGITEEKQEQKSNDATTDKMYEEFMDMHAFSNEQVEQLARENERPVTTYLREMEERTADVNESGRTRADDYYADGID